jgi:Kdo2-lipid IVA lauroyltransferase/acyltransferase
VLPIPFKLRILARKRKVFDLVAIDNPKELPLFTRNLRKISFRVRTPVSNRLEYLATVLIAAYLRLWPRRWRSAFGAWLGQLVYIIGIRRQVTHDNLQAAFPDLPERAIRTVTARVFRHFGRVATSFVSLSSLRKDDVGKWIFVEGWEVLTKALDEGKGAITVSGHLGNWEIMGCLVSRCGFPSTFVVASQSNPLVEELIDRYRIAAGVEIVKKRDAIRGVMTALKRNRLVAMLIDQDAHEDGVFVPFFGRPASTPRGPAVFHVRTGAPIIFVTCIRLPGDRYRIRFDRFDSQGETDPDIITARLSERLEQAVRETPEQWLWMHRRWKTSPSAS